jgi:hypothetical protein
MSIVWLVILFSFQAIIFVLIVVLLLPPVMLRIFRPFALTQRKLPTQVDMIPSAPMSLRPHHMDRNQRPMMEDNSSAPTYH